jgi:hypothetical protein
VVWRLGLSWCGEAAVAACCMFYGTVPMLPQGPVPSYRGVWMLGLMCWGCDNCRQQMRPRMVGQGRGAAAVGGLASNSGGLCV